MTCDEIDENHMQIHDAEEEFNKYYTKSEADAKYVLKPPNALVLEERQYMLNSGRLQFAGQFGKHFVIRGLLTGGVSFEINQVINANGEVNAGNNRVMQINASIDGKTFIINTNNIYSIECCAAYVEMADEYVLKSDFDKLLARVAALEAK